MKWFFILIFPIFNFAVATPAQPNAQEFEALLKLSYQDFDQNLPKGGWRSIEDNVEAGKVLDAYFVQHSDTLTESEKRVITWHAGQAYALGGLKDLALTRFKNSFDPEEKPNNT